MPNGYSLAFSEDSDISALKKFNEWTIASNQLAMDSFEVYMWFLSPLLQCTDVFYIGMTRVSKQRIDHALKYEFPKLYPDRTVYRLVIKNHLSKTCAECLEASLQTGFGNFFNFFKIKPFFFMF
jgi:hypothetical protein